MEHCPQIHLSFYCNCIHQKSDSNLTAMWWENESTLSCKTMLDIVDHFRPIIPAIDSKAISRRELMFDLTLGDTSVNLQNIIIFTIRSCVHRSINNARSKLINKVKAQLSRVMLGNYNLTGLAKK